MTKQPYVDHVHVIIHTSYLFFGDTYTLEVNDINTCNIYCQVSQTQRKEYTRVRVHIRPVHV